MKIRILILLFIIWLKHPYLRFCQLIQNCFGTMDIYYVEDEELIQRLIQTYLK